MGIGDIYIENDIISLNKKVQIQQNIQWSYFMEIKRDKYLDKLIIRKQND